MTVADIKIIKSMLLSDIAKVTTRHETEEGYLDVHANISRSGIYEYQAGELGIIDKDPAQIIRVLRTDEEVFNKSSMQSFAKKPVTDNHPPTMVDSGNNRYYGIGQSGEVIVKDGNSLSASLLITDKDAVQKIKDGTVELSCGYQADIMLESGNDAKFGPFDAIQKNIRGNHIAIVEKGRAGSSCKIKDKKTFNDNKGVNTMNIMFNDVQIEVTEQGKQAIDSLQSQLSGLNTKLSDAVSGNKTETEKLIADHKSVVDKLQGELDGAKSQIPDTKQLDSLVADRTAIIDSASKVIKDFKSDGKSNLDIKKEVLIEKTEHTDEGLKDKSDDYIDGLFSGVTAAFTKGSDNFQLVGDAKPGELVSTGDDLEDARNKSIKDGLDAWKKD